MNLLLALSLVSDTCFWSFMGSQGVPLNERLVFLVSRVIRISSAVFDLLEVPVYTILVLIYIYYKQTIYLYIYIYIIIFVHI